MILLTLSNYQERGYLLIGHFDIADEPFVASDDDMVIYLSVRDALLVRDRLPVEIHLRDTSQDAVLLMPLRERARAWNIRAVVKR